MLVLLCGSTACSSGLPFGDSEERRAVEIAEEYLTAIVDGRVEDAHAMMSDPSFAPLPDEIYAATEHRVESFTIDDAGSSSFVGATLESDEGTREIEVYVDPDADEVIDADSWNLLAFTVTYEDARPLINGASIPGQPVAGPVGEIEFHAPPGMYVLDADVGSLLAVEEQTVDFGLGASADETSGVRLRPELGDEGRELAQQQVDELVERCLENHDQGDDTCPNQPPANADPDPDSVEWTLLKQPTVQWSRADGDHIGGIIEYDDFFSATWTEDGEPKSRDTIGWGSSSVEARVSREDELSVEITDLG